MERWANRLSLKNWKKSDYLASLRNDEERMTELASILTWQECEAGDEVISEGVEGSDLLNSLLR